MIQTTTTTRQKISDYKEGLILKSNVVHSAVDKQLTNYDLRGKNANLFKL